MGGDGLVGHLECAVCGLLAVVGCGCEAEDYQPVSRQVRLWKDRLHPGLLLAPDLRKLTQLFFCYLCVGWCRAWGRLGGGGWLLALLGECRHNPEGCMSAGGDGTCGYGGNWLRELVMVLVNWEICFCISRSLSFITLRPGILTVTDSFANWCVILARMKRQIGSSSRLVVSLVVVVWSSSDFHVRELASVSVSWSQSGA